MGKRFVLLLCVLINSFLSMGQIDTEKVMIIGRNALYYEDYVLSIQYFNQVIKTKPFLPEPYFYRAIAKYYLDDIKGAEEDCSLCIERNPFFMRAYQLRGDARLALDNFDGAIDDYQKTLDYSPDNKYALVNMGISNIQKKNYDQAEIDLTELLRVYPKYTQGLLTRGAMYVEKGDTIRAFQDYDAAIEADKYYATSYSMRGLLHYNKKDYDKALADLDEAIKIDPLITGNYINRGLIRYSKNDLRGAMSDYDKVIEKESSNIIARFNRGLLRAQVGDDNRAIEDFNVVLKDEPKNYTAYLNRALLRENIGDYRGSISDMNIVLEEYPDFYQGFYTRSEMKRRLNDLKGAEKDYLYARKEESKLQQLSLRGDYSGDKKDGKDKDNKEGKTREQSDKDIEKFNLLVVADAKEQEKSKYDRESRGRVQNRQVKIELEPRFVASYYEKSNDMKIFLKTDKTIEDINKRGLLSRNLIITNNEASLSEQQINVHFSSIDEYSRLISDKSTNPYYFFGRGMDYMLVQDFASAIKDFQTAVDLKPDFLLAYFNLAVVYTKQLELREYVPGYDLNQQSDQKISKALSSDRSSSGLVINGVAVQTTPTPTDFESKKNERVIEYDLILKNYNKVLELNPNFIYAYYNRAEIKSMLGDYRGAIIDYNELLKIDPDFGDAYFNRGLDRLQIGEKEKGLNDLRKAGELGVINAYNIIKRMTE